MAAGLGFKDFTTGEVLTAADVDGYLMQGIWVFDDATARDAAVTSPQEGNACYLKDTNEVLTYSGSVWVAVGGAGGMTLLSTTTLTGVSVTLSGISQDYTNLLIIVENVRSTTANDCQVRMNSATGNIKQAGFKNSNSTYVSNLTTIALQADDTDPETFALAVLVYRYASTTGIKPFNFIGYGNSGGGVNAFDGIVNTTSAITSIQIANGDGTPTFSDGTVYLYGVK